MGRGAAICGGQTEKKSLRGRKVVDSLQKSRPKRAVAKFSFWDSRRSLGSDGAIAKIGNQRGRDRNRTILLLILFQQRDVKSG